MAVETGQALDTAIWNRLTTDTALKALMGGSVRLYRVMATQDALMPYLVHRSVAPVWPLSKTPYYLDVWYYGENSATVDSIVERIRVLLENWRITTGDGEWGAGRMEFDGSGYVQTDNELVWHYATVWTISGISDRLTGLVG